MTTFVISSYREQENMDSKQNNVTRIKIAL